MAELKPCPFCGKKPFHYYFTDGFNSYSRVSCNECGVSLTKKHIIGTEAIEAWNRRTKIETNIYDQEETYPNCTVQVLTNTVTGEVSVGWWENGGKEDG